MRRRSIPRHTTVAAMVVALVLGGCLSVEPPDGVLECTTAAECPSSEWVCRASRCHRTGGGDVDASTPRDAATDAPIDRDAEGIDGGDVDAEVDAGPLCGSGQVCAPAAPTGWMGPVVLVTGPGAAPAPSCPAGAPSTAFTAQSGLTAAPAVCGCACGAPAAGQMSCAPTVTLRTASNCLVVGVAHTTLTNNTCAAIPNLPSGFMTVARPAFMSTGGCTPAPSTDLPPPTWAASHRGCGFGTPTPCGDADVCVPPLESGERLCVYVDGATACPAAFPDLLETGTGATDTRACSACSCGSITGTCEGRVDITNPCPGTVLAGSVGIGMCESTSGIGTGRSATATYAPTGSCTPSAVAPTGAAAPTGVRTVCCAAE